jgi:RNA polymerase sigma-70 factor (ECF subfamily)
MRSDAEIVRVVLRGDRDAFAVLVGRHERAVWATAWAVLRDHHAAADAAQDAFLLAFRRLDRLSRPDRFGAWLLRIARRESVRIARRRARDPCRSIGGGDADAVGIAGPSSRLSAGSEEILAALAGLPEHERVVVSMRYLDLLPVAEIAAALDRPVGTVTKQLSRAIARLKSKAKGVMG